MDIEPSVVIRIIIDLCCLAIVSVPILILWVSAIPFHRGFYCDDESLMYPHKPDTVPTWLASTAAILVPTISIIILEGVKLKVFSRNARTGATIRAYITLLYRNIGTFWFGAAVTQLTTDIAKYSLGRLRPHFLTICKPNITCTANLGYIDGDVCTGTDSAALREARLSFPSGHASITMYAFVYVVIYLQIRFQWRRCFLLRPFIQLILFYMTYFTCLSRIFDYMHHWSDVLGGAFIGVVVCSLMIFFVSDLADDLWCKKSSPGTRLASSLPLYKSTRQDDDRISVQTSTESAASN